MENILKNKKMYQDRLRDDIMNTIYKNDGKSVLVKSVSDPKKSMKEKFEKFGITNKEREIVLKIMNGLEYKEIGNDLGISLSTIKTHVQNIFKKTGVKNKIELINIFK
jgi:DNA-binding NarL/FixJ family response regulator